jgi:hypothetical protein
VPRRALALLAPLLLAACAGTPARDAPPDPPKPEDAPFAACSGPARDEVAVIDGTRRRLHETLCGAPLWFDGLFGTGDVAAARRAHGLLETSVAHSEFEGTKTRVRFNARVELPALERRVSGFIGRDDDEEFVRDRSEGLGLRSQFPSVTDQEEWLAGLGYALPEAHRFKFDFRVGARSLRNPTVFARARVSYNAYSDARNLVHLRTTPFLDNQVGLGLTTSVDVDHALTPACLLRWGTIGTIHEKSPGLDWRSAVIAYQNLRELRAVAGEVFLRGATAASEDIPEYGIRAIYRHPLFEARMFAELILGYSWLQYDPAVPREGSEAVTFGLELPFGKD